jgi:hypothetical protein
MLESPNSINYKKYKKQKPVKVPEILKVKHKITALEILLVKSDSNIGNSIELYKLRNKHQNSLFN